MLPINPYKFGYGVSFWGSSIIGAGVRPTTRGLGPLVCYISSWGVPTWAIFQSAARVRNPLSSLRIIVLSRWTRTRARCHTLRENPPSFRRSFQKRRITGQKSPIQRSEGRSRIGWRSEHTVCFILDVTPHWFSCS